MGRGAKTTRQHTGCFQTSMDGRTSVYLGLQLNYARPVGSPCHTMQPHNRTPPPIATTGLVTGACLPFPDGRVANRGYRFAYLAALRARHRWFWT